MQTARLTLALGIALLATACVHSAPPPAAAPPPAKPLITDRIHFPAQPLGVEVPIESGLIIPVEGIRPAQLRDTYHDARSGGRTHAAIDIMAPRGAPVLAAADGRIIKLHQGATGGIAVYHLDDDGRTRYYYAHLDGYAEGLREGQRVQRGEVIGYVGDTGNAGAGNYHLHFSIALLSDPRRWWEGENLNPYPLLRWGSVASSRE
jgi:peptidoglycan LD-endopeptidase LytH